MENSTRGIIDLLGIRPGSESTSIVSLPICPAGLGTGRRAELRLADLAPSVIARFHQKVQKTESCWLWTGTKERHGYGQVYTHRRMDGRRVQNYAHRVAYVIAKGRVPAHLEVMHRCDVPGCVNPDHLTLGTHADNMADSAAKGRRAKVKPTLRKISPEQVIEIRASTEHSQTLADRFGVHEAHIRHIRRGSRRKAA